MWHRRRSFIGGFGFGVLPSGSIFISAKAIRYISKVDGSWYNVNLIVKEENTFAPRSQVHCLV